MVHHADDLRKLKTLNGLAGLVVVGEHDLLRVGLLLDGVEHARLGRVGLGEELLGLGGQRAQAARLVGVAVVVDLVEKLAEDDRRHDGVVIGVEVSEDENVAHELSPFRWVFVTLLS